MLIFNKQTILLNKIFNNEGSLIKSEISSNNTRGSFFLGFRILNKYFSLDTKQDYRA